MILMASITTDLLSMLQFYFFCQHLFHVQT